jgi:hypothetical protein
MRCQSILKALIGSAVIAALAGFGLNSASAQFHYYRVGRTTFGVRPGGFYYHSPRATYAAAPGYVYHSNPHYRVAVGGSTFYYSNPRFTYASVPGSFYYANNAYAMGAIPGGVYYNTPQFTYAGNSSSYKPVATKRSYQWLEKVSVKNSAKSSLARQSCGGRLSRVRSCWVQWVSFWDWRLRSPSWRLAATTHRRRPAATFPRISR